MYIGTDTRGFNIPLSDDERRRHTFVLGGTGSGKSTLLARMMIDDLKNDRPFALLDPHGDLSQLVADHVPVSLTNRVLYLDPLDPSHVMGFNPIGHAPLSDRSQVAANIVASFYHVWGDSWGPRMEYILGHAVRLLLDNRTTLLGLPRLLTDDRYRAQLLRNSTDPFNHAYWVDEYDRYEKRFRLDAIAPIQNKAGQFTANSHLRAVIGQEKGLDIPTVLNRPQYLIGNLNKAMGEKPSHLLGAFLATAFAQAAQARALIPEEQRQDFTLYVDEFQAFASSAFASILSEARKWRLNLVLANQFLGQVPDDLRRAALGNVSTLIAFRVGAEDAETLSRELDLPPATLRNTPNHFAWVRKDTSTSVRMKTHPTPEPLGRLQAVRERSRAQHAVARKVVEERIGRFIEGG